MFRPSRSKHVVEIRRNLHANKEEENQILTSSSDILYARHSPHSKEPETTKRFLYYFRCYTVHVVELLNDYTKHCIYIKFIKFTH